MLKLVSYNVILLLCFHQQLSAQLAPYYPVRITSDIELDGDLKELEWQQAVVIDDWMQYDPTPGLAPTEHTECRILYNDTYLFVGFTCYDSDVSKIISNSLERDYLFLNDDGIGLVIDSYRDKSTGIVFNSNLNGARKDRLVFLDGDGQNPNFNTFWDAKAKLHSDRYTMEFRIPFSSLRFQAADKVTMGFRFFRFIKRKSEFDIYPICDPNIVNAYFRVSLAQEVIFDNLKSSTPIYLSPYVIGNYTEEYTLKTDSSGYNRQFTFLQRKNFFKNEALDKLISNIGLDIKYGLTKNSTLDLTLNTDFAQAEVDNRIINLTKYDVNLPERRSFFLESDDYFRFSTSNSNELFISRSIGIEQGQIVPIIGGARLTGIIGGFQTGILEMQTAGVPEVGIQPHNYFVFRPLKRFGNLGSSVGAIFSNRLNTSSDINSRQTFGIDFVKRFTQLSTLKVNLSSTFSDFKWTTPALRNLCFDISLTRFAFKGLFYNPYFVYVGSEFDPTLGFVDDNGYAEGRLRYGYSFIAPEKSKLVNSYFTIANRYRMRTLTGQQETFSNALWWSFYFKNQTLIEVGLVDYTIDSLPFDWHLDHQNAISTANYSMLSHILNFESASNKNYLLTLYAKYGDFYGGKRLFISPVLSWIFNKHFSTELTYEYNNIHFNKYLNEDRKTIFRSNLFRLSFSYLLSTKFSIKLIAQYDNLSRTVGSNLRIRYNPKEGTDLYLVINRDSNTNLSRLDPMLPASNAQAATVKFVRTFGQ